MKRLQTTRRYTVNFDARELPRIRTGCLVIGSGVTGLRAAIEAAAATDVMVICKDVLTECNTEHAQGGIAAVLREDDSVEDHIADTLKTGAGLCDENVVRSVVTKGPAHLIELVDWGAKFDTENDAFVFGREGGHSMARIVHAHGDATGHEVERALIARAKSTDRLTLRERLFLLELLTQDERCVGALVADAAGQRHVIEAGAIVLATGGAGRVYRETTNRSVTTGDGMAAAYRAGAALVDMEFMQFHPTTLYIAGAARTLISEAVRGEGAILRDRFGVHFMPNYHPDAELAPRDIVSRSILKQMESTGDTNVYLDLRHLGRNETVKRFPSIVQTLRTFDLDPAEDLIPVRPSAHYMVGGVGIDSSCRTNIPGLFAAGEASCSFLHGANRLASNSLLEGLVMGACAGREAGEEAAGKKPPRVSVRSEKPLSAGGAINLSDVANALKATMWRWVGIERDREGLHATGDRLDFWGSYVLDRELTDPDGWQLQNMLILASLMTLAAATREETRGTHHRTDFPDRDDDTWRKHITIQRGKELVIA